MYFVCDRLCMCTCTLLLIIIIARVIQSVIVKLPAYWLSCSFSCLFLIQSFYPFIICYIHLSHDHLRILLLLTVYMYCHLDLSTLLK